MSVPEDSLAELRKQVAYYRKRLDEQAGELVRADYKISELRHEVRQKRQGFTLLSALQERTAGLEDAREVLLAAAGALNSELGMDRTVVLDTAADGSLVPVRWYGFNTEDGALLEGSRFVFPEVQESQDGLLLVTKATVRDPLISSIDAATGLLSYVCLPVLHEGTSASYVITGRVKEVWPLYPPMDLGDVETVRALTRFLAARVQELRIGALHEMDRVKTEFFANISHEFRTPITLTLGPLGALIKGRYGELDGDQREVLTLMHRNQTRLLGLVNQILDIAKLEAGGVKLSLVRHSNLNTRVEQVAEQFRGLAESRGVALAIDLDASVADAEIYLDVERFDKLLFNLLSNAVKFTAEGTISVATELQPQGLLLRVSDTGIGIRASELRHVFDRFRQAQGSETRDFAGTGLGLALVQEIASVHGGAVTVESTYGEGTCFTATFPVGADAHDASLIRAEPAEVQRPALPDLASSISAQSENTEARARRSLARPLVLYADDNPDLRRFVRSLLEPKYDVFVARNGLEGLELAKELQPDLILSDLMMPEMTGAQFCSAIREDEGLRGTPFVLLTAAASQGSKLEGLEHGADDYLTKPFSEEELDLRVRNLLKLRAQHLQMARDLQAAREIQRALLPADPCVIGGLKLESLYQPSEALSGDFYDLIERDGVAYGYVIDVASHGTAAAQVTYLVHQLFRGIVRRTDTPSLAAIVRTLAARYAELGLAYDVSLQAFAYRSSSGAFEYLRANAPPAFRFGEVTEVLTPMPGPVLSATQTAGVDRHYACKTVQLPPGDSVFVFSDGAFEFPTPRGAYGLRRLQRVLRSCGGVPKWRSEVLDALTQERAGTHFEDDLTVLRLTPDRRG